MITEFQAFIIEFVLAFFYSIVYFSTVFNKKVARTIFGISLGGVVFAGTLAFGALSGACVNPVRIFGPHLWTGNLCKSFGYYFS